MWGVLQNTNAFSEMKKEVKVPIKFIHVQRNPFDIVGTFIFRKVTGSKEKFTQGPVCNKSSYTQLYYLPLLFCSNKRIKKGKKCKYILVLDVSLTSRPCKINHCYIHIFTRIELFSNLSFS